MRTTRSHDLLGAIYKGRVENVPPGWMVLLSILAQILNALSIFAVLEGAQWHSEQESAYLFTAQSPRDE